MNVKDASKNEILEKLREQYQNASQDIKERFEDKVLKIRQGDDLLPSVMKNGESFRCNKEKIKTWR